jgi:Sucrose hydrolase-like, C-terminal domain
LNWTERIIRMRKEVPEVGWGDFAIIPVRNHAILIIRYDWRNNSVLFIHNFDPEPHEIAFATKAEGEHGDLLVNLLGTEHSSAGDDGKHHLLIEGYGYRWYRVGGLDYLLRRTDIGWYRCWQWKSCSRRRGRVETTNQTHADRQFIRKALAAGGIVVTETFSPRNACLWSRKIRTSTVGLEPAPRTLPKLRRDFVKHR